MLKKYVCFSKPYLFLILKNILFCSYIVFILHPNFSFWIVYVGNFCSLPTIKMFKNRPSPYNVAILKCFIITWFLDCLLVLQTVCTVENKISWRWRSLKICHKMLSTDTGHRPTAASNKPLQFLLRKLTSWGDYRAIYIVLNVSWHFDRFFLVQHLISAGRKTLQTFFISKKFKRLF